MSAFTFPSCRSRSRPIEPGRVQPWRVANCPRRAERGELPQYVATAAPSGHRAACPLGRARGERHPESGRPAAVRRHARPRDTAHAIGPHCLRRVLVARRSVTWRGATAVPRFDPETGQRGAAAVKASGSADSTAPAVIMKRTPCGTSRGKARNTGSRSDTGSSTSETRRSCGRLGVGRRRRPTRRVVSIRSGGAPRRGCGATPPSDCPISRQVRSCPRRGCCLFPVGWEGSPCPG